ncbi:MAG: radical SAM protein [Thermoanaerobaculales bacterium]|nr:radical SAM protein [Thermoanaerobaculales bacterium]
MAKRGLRALQVEVTSRCTRRCAVCPRAALGERWLEGDLSEAHWDRLRPDLPLVEHLHLQGWGEPLLHPDLETMALDAAAAGCRVGVTTNGDLLGDAMGWIVDGPVDILAVSLAGGRERNRRLRDGSRPDELFAAVEELVRARGRRKKPRIHISFLLVRGNAEDLAETVRAAAAAGADAIFVNHLDCVPTEELRTLAAYSDGAVQESVQRGLAEAENVARDLGIDIRLPVTEPQEMLTCALDPRVMTSVRWDGVVAPCVQLNLPISGPTPRMTEEGTVEIPPFHFGDLDEAPLSAILAGAARQEFTAPLKRRCDADTSFQDSGLLAPKWGAVALADLDRAYGELERELAENPFPRPCRGCPKTEGW